MNLRQALSQFSFLSDPRELLPYLHDIENDESLVLRVLDLISVELDVWEIILDRLLDVISPTREMFEHLLIHDMDHYLAPIFRVLMKHHCPANVDSEFMRSALLYQPDDICEYMIYANADIPELNMPLSDPVRKALMITHPMVAIPQLYSNFNNEQQQILITTLLINSNWLIYLPPELMFEIFRHI